MVNTYLVFPKTGKLLCRIGLLALWLGCLVWPGSARADERTPMETPLTDAGFSLIGTRDGLRMYEKPDGALIRLAFEGTVQASVETLMLAVTDYPHQIGVMKHVGEIRVLACTPYEMVVYQRLRIPVISDRDYILRVHAEHAGATGIVHYAALARSSLVPVRQDAVRLRTHNGSWQFTPSPDGKGTRVRYQTALDFAGWIPRWMVRPGMIDELPIVFRNLQELATRTSKEQHPCYMDSLK